MSIFHYFFVSQRLAVDRKCFLLPAKSHFFHFRFSLYLFVTPLAFAGKESTTATWSAWLPLTSRDSNQYKLYRIIHSIVAPQRTWLSTLVSGRMFPQKPWIYKERRRYWGCGHYRQLRSLQILFQHFSVQPPSCRRNSSRIPTHRPTTWSFRGGFHTGIFWAWHDNCQWWY